MRPRSKDTVEMTIKVTRRTWKRMQQLNKAKDPPNWSSIASDAFRHWLDLHAYRSSKEAK